MYDYGFAPNPFSGICTLATCKPRIRKKAVPGDWIIGTGTKENDLEGELIYAMQISEKVSFEEYAREPRFKLKKPLIPGSLKRIHGDNIYYPDEKGIWHQRLSQHSNPDTSENYDNMKRDLSGKFVLVSNQFFYFGNKHFAVPSEFKSVCSRLRDYLKITDIQVAEKFIQFLKTHFIPGIHGDPVNWIEYSQRILF
jgi:hypothetical protein